jgi:DNA-binding SARP family transcriptional activator
VSVALRSLGSLVVAVVALAALAVLWRFRPEWPALPDSLSSPVTTALLQQLALVAAWLLAALGILVLLVQSLRGMRASPRVTLGGGAWHTGTPPNPRLRRVGTPGILQPLAEEPSLLVAKPYEGPPTPLAEGAVDSTSNLQARAGPEPDDRPLVSLLGPLTVYGGKQSRRGLRARALELIAFLALRQEGAQRDEILEALWPGEDPKRSRHRLYQAVRDARRLLGDAVASERDRYWLDRTYADVDVDELERLLARAKAAEPEHAQALIDSALRLFRGDPLAGSDYAWSETEVPRLRATFVDLLEQVARQRLEAREARAALDAALRGLDVDTLNESLWRLAMEAESALGLREAVSDRYERLRAILDERLGLEPEQETRRLHRRLLAQT